MEHVQFFDHIRLTMSCLQQLLRYVIVTLAPPWVFAGLLISHGTDVRWMDMMRELSKFSFRFMTSHRLGRSTPMHWPGPRGPGSGPQTQSPRRSQFLGRLCLASARPGSARPARYRGRAFYRRGLETRNFWRECLS